MLIIGERINSSRKEIFKAIESRDEGLLRRIARQQVEAGADYIDVNAGAFIEGEVEHLVWLVEVVQKETDRPLCIDSPNPKAIEKAMVVHRGTPMINSISLEKERYRAMIPLVKESKGQVIGLCMGDEGIPKTEEERVKIAEKLIGRLNGDGIPFQNIFIDPIIQPLAVDSTSARAVLSAIRRIRVLHPEVHIVSGLSNLSHGLPSRKLINRAFLLMAMAVGMDAAILDPCDPVMVANLKAAQLIMGEDDFCMRYIKTHRDGKFEGLA